MKGFTFPDSKLINTTIDSDISQFDLSYSDNIKQFIAELMDIDISLLKDLKCAFFTNFNKISDNFVVSPGPFQRFVGGVFRVSDNMLLISIDSPSNSENQLTIVHETGHYLSLNYLSVSVAEGCAVSYERKFAQKNDKMDEFNKKYNSKSIETYYYSYIFLDMIKDAVFNNDDEEFYNYTKRGSHNEFTNKLDNYLKSIGCTITSRELLFLMDVTFYNRTDKEMSRAFKKTPPYFYSIFDELHNVILPVLFSKSSSREQIIDANNRLDKYRNIITQSFQILESIKKENSYEIFSTFLRLFQQNLAKKFKELDTNEYFKGKLSNNEFSSTLSNCIISAFENTSFTYAQYQDLEIQQKSL